LRKNETIRFCSLNIDDLARYIKGHEGKEGERVTEVTGKEAKAARPRGRQRRRPVRTGRPPATLAGEVEERILDAAAKVFLERGFDGASIDEIADVARAGKPTIYARFAGKEALFVAVIGRLVRQHTGSLQSVAALGSTLQNRLEYLAEALLRNVLAPQSIGLCRAAVAEARRFPKLASSVHRMARELGIEGVARVLGELTRSDATPPLPAFTTDRLPATTRRFIDMILLPMLLRALFGEDLAALESDIGPHVSSTVAFFLAACRQGGA
jgi:AcrR family transcriptional regulator